MDETHIGPYLRPPPPPIPTPGVAKVTCKGPNKLKKHIFNVCLRFYISLADNPDMYPEIIKTQALDAKYSGNAPPDADGNILSVAPACLLQWL